MGLTGARSALGVGPGVSSRGPGTHRLALGGVGMVGPDWSAEPGVLALEVAVSVREPSPQASGGPDGKQG